MHALVNRFVSGAEAADLLDRASVMPRVMMDTRAACDADMIASGALSPLEGFLNERDYFSTITQMRLTSGALFPLPITLSVSLSDRRKYKEGYPAALTTYDGRIVGVIHVDDIFPLNRELEATEVYRTDDKKHPGVGYLFAHRGEVGLGGKITLAQRAVDIQFPKFHRDPAEMREAISARGWQKVVAFQTRNPIHRAHEYLLRCALETVDGLVVHPLVGETKSDDVKASVRMECYETLLSQYFPESRVMLSTFPFAMRYAGPREALLHALSRQNYGFTHFIVGRDHAGVGNYYGTYDSQRIFNTLKPGDLSITPIFFEHSFHCKSCGGVSSLKTCPHPAEDRLTLSGSSVRELLVKGQGLPPEYTRPEIALILTRAYLDQAYA